MNSLDGSPGIQSPYANPQPGMGYLLHWHHQAPQTIAELKLTFHGSDCFLWDLLQSWKSLVTRQLFLFTKINPLFSKNYLHTDEGQEWGKESSRGRVTQSHLNRAFCVVLEHVTFLYIYISILKRNLNKISVLRDVGNYNSMEQKS